MSGRAASGRGGAILVMGLGLLTGGQGGSVRGQLAPSFTPLVTGAPFDSYPNYAYALSADGTQVTGTAWNSSDRAAFSWTQQTGMTNLVGLSPLFARSEGLAISADGKFIVGYRRDFETQQTLAYRWEKLAGPLPLGVLQGGTASLAFDVSTNGDVVVGECDYGFSAAEAFRWTPTEGMKGLGDLPGGFQFSLATGVSADGVNIVGIGNYDPAGGTSGQAFLWTPHDGMTGLGFLPGTSISYAWGISADGEVVVGHCPGGGILRQAFVWRSWSGLVGLGYLPGGWPNSSAQSASLAGLQIVGVARNGTGQQEAFVFDDAYGMRTVKGVLTTQCGLNLGTWRLNSATAISDDGSTIIGVGQNPDGLSQCWRAVIPPSGDLNADGVTDGRDIQVFIDAARRGSVYRPDLIRGDFDRDRMIDPGDAAGMAAALLRGTPPVD